ncbi:MAG: nucleotidyl transferase AbiEii/AbiGii toxin family protein [Desulfobacteraceae bacterium]|jgi:predicted nucleotidyltransferase component of viral defense system|nr:nucleotidyl transferase AbiEii/AbiGii toxin family protein [Desulfobacteraceae bacterium]
MNEAVAKMLERYDNRSLEDHLQALREILQEIALLGLWRSKFFDKAAFYGGTALRILYGLDRFSEDMDFSLLSPMADFHLSTYTAALQKELAAFGFNVRMEQTKKSAESAVQSAFLKANTLNQLLSIDTSEALLKTVHRGQVLKIKLEIDTDPPPEFETHTRYLLQPIPFAVRTYTLPDLFAGKMHAILCRQWKTRVKGRDWYDLVWYAAHHPQLHLSHLEQRMRQSGHWNGEEALSEQSFHALMHNAIERVSVDQARREVEPFVSNPESLKIWSRDFFRDVASRIQLV